MQDEEIARAERRFERDREAAGARLPDKRRVIVGSLGAGLGLAVTLPQRTSEGALVEDTPLPPGTYEGQAAEFPAEGGDAGAKGGDGQTKQDRPAEDAADGDGDGVGGGAEAPGDVQGQRATEVAPAGDYNWRQKQIRHGR